MESGFSLFIIGLFSFFIPVPLRQGNGFWQTLKWHYRKAREQAILFIGSPMVVLGIAIFWVGAFQTIGIFKENPVHIVTSILMET